MGFTKVRFDYNAQRDDWDAQGKLNVFGLVTIDATPDPPDPPEYGVHFCGGESKSAGAAVDFGDAGITIFSGIQLNRIGIAVSLNPTLLIGDAGLRVVELVQVNGRVIVAFPSDSAPCQLSTGDAGPQFAQIAGRSYTGSPDDRGRRFGGSAGLRRQSRARQRLLPLQLPVLCGVRR